MFSCCINVRPNTGLTNDARWLEICPHCIRYAGQCKAFHFFNLTRLLSLIAQRSLSHFLFCSAEIKARI